MSDYVQSEADGEKQTLYLFNPGIGDQSWLARDELLRSVLQPYFFRGACILQVMSAGLVCGGFYYKLDILSNASEIIAAVKGCGVRESNAARKAFAAK